MPSRDQWRRERDECRAELESLQRLLDARTDYANQLCEEHMVLRRALAEARGYVSKYDMKGDVLARVDKALFGDAA